MNAPAFCFATASATEISDGKLVAAVVFLDISQTAPKPRTTRAMIPQST
jgi:hypothetical protein